MGICPKEDPLPIPIKMPALSPTMTQGHLILWHKNLNDAVSAGDLLLEIETDKAVMEVEATQSGILDYLAVPAGTNDVPVGKILAVLRTPLEAEGVGQGWWREQEGKGSQDSVDTTEKVVPKPKDDPMSVTMEKGTSVNSPLGAASSLSKAEASPVAGNPLVTSPLASWGKNTLGDGDALRTAAPLLRDSPRTMDFAQGTTYQGQAGNVHGPSQGLEPSTEERILASPLARKWAQHHGISLSHVQGTGPRGRIVKEDVISALGHPPMPRDFAISKKVVSRALEDEKYPSLVGKEGHVRDGYHGEIGLQAQATPGQENPAHDQSKALSEGTLAPKTVPLSGMRRTIAQRLTLSKQTVPHFSLQVECRMDALLALRSDMNGGTKDISLNDCMVRACAMALRAVPEMRLMWGDEAHGLQHEQVDLAVAVSLPGGLITPILTCADTKSLREISREMKTLIGRAREGKLAPREYQGGLFTLSNLGMMGVDAFTPIINPPHTGILAIGATKQRPVVDEKGNIIAAHTMVATVSADHRTIDGSTAAAFLTTFQNLVQHPLRMVM